MYAVFSLASVFLFFYFIFLALLLAPDITMIISTRAARHVPSI